MHDCDEARERVEAARRAVDKEVSDLNIARILWYAALVTGNPYLIQVARDNLNRAIEQLEKARNNLTLALSDYYRVYLINRNLIKLSFNLI